MAGLGGSGAWKDLKVRDRQPWEKDVGKPMRDG